MWVTRSLSLFYHSVNCILRRLPRVQEITFHCFYSQGLMILKVPPSDLYKNANLAELRCDKKKFVLVFSLHWEFWSVQESLSPQIRITHAKSCKKHTVMLYLQYVDLYVVRTLWNCFHLEKNLTKSLFHFWVVFISNQNFYSWCFVTVSASEQIHVDFYNNRILIH